MGHNRSDGRSDRQDLRAMGAGEILGLIAAHIIGTAIAGSVLLGGYFGMLWIYWRVFSWVTGIEPNFWWFSAGWSVALAIALKACRKS